MFQNLIVLSIILSLKLVSGAPNETVISSCVYDDEPIIKMQHKLELLTSLNENVRLQLEILDRRLSDSSHENNLIFEILSEINRKLPGENSTNLGNDKCKKNAYPTSCLNLAGGHQLIQIDSFSPKPFFVYCDNVTQGGGWTVIQRRMDGSVDFYRNWTDYKHGFGNLAQEFFIGLDKLHELTTSSVNELLIVMRDKEKEERFAKYDAFAIGDEDEYYALNVLGKYSGDAGDNLSKNQSGRFSTKDKDSPSKCAVNYMRAWWERDDYCFCSLNGKYGDDTHAKGINWIAFRGYKYSLPYVQMMIRPKSQ